MSPHVLSDPPDRASSWKIHVYAHTHWDREWYQPFERFRMQLVAAIDLLIDTLRERDDFPTFVLDGQTIVIDDYLAIRPEREAQLAELIATGRIEVGPWYILPDEFLVSGESIVRNLLEGRRRSERLGRCTNIGYLPDPFGHIAQLPQILRGFGIDSMIFSRGMGDEFPQLGNEFRWFAPDRRSSVLALVQTATYTNGYCNAEVLSKAHVGGDVPLHVTPDELAPMLASKLAGQARSSVLLFAAGCDHETVNPWLPDLVRDMQAGFVNAHIEIGGLAAYVNAVRASLDASGVELASHAGELRGALHAPILAAIFSARIPLKQDNVLVQSMLERVVEPVVSIASAVGLRRADTGMLDHAWRLAMQNQPHDSIGGCSVDETHLDMPGRTRAALQVAEGMVEDVIIAAGLEQDAVVFNPHPVPCSAVVQRADGSWRHVSHLPGLSLQPLDDASSSAGVARVVTQRSIASDCMSVDVAPDGRVRIVNEQSAAVCHDAVTFVDVGDVGDEYDFSPGRGQLIAKFISAEAGSDCRGEAHIDLIHELVIPERADTAHHVTIPIRTRLQVVDGQPWVECTVSFTNTACDHRLRMRSLLDAKIASTHGDGHFAWTRRDPRPAAPKVTWAQQPVPSQYCESGVAATTEEGHGCAFLTRGLHEYEAVELDDGSSGVELTLLRSVGWLSRDTIEGRPGHAGPALSTPGAQCIGAHRLELAIVPFTADEVHLIPAHARRFAAPIHVIKPINSELRQHSGQQARERDVRAARQLDDTQRAEVVRRLAAGMLSVEGAVELSAVKPASDGSGDLIVRVFNPHASDTTSTIICGWSVASVTIARLDEQVDTAADVCSIARHGDRTVISCSVPACGITTLRLVSG